MLTLRQRKCCPSSDAAHVTPAASTVPYKVLVGIEDKEMRDVKHRDRTDLIAYWIASDDVMSSIATR